MLHGIFEKYKIHNCIDIIVLSETFMQSLRHSFSRTELIIQLVIKTCHELGQDEWCWCCAEIFLQIEFGE
jgi:hypothetical protein